MKNLKVSFWAVQTWTTTAPCTQRRTNSRQASTEFLVGFWWSYSGQGAHLAVLRAYLWLWLRNHSRQCSRDDVRSQGLKPPLLGARQVLDLLYCHSGSWVAWLVLANHNILSTCRQKLTTMLPPKFHPNHWCDYTQWPTWPLARFTWPQDLEILCSLNATLGLLWALWSNPNLVPSHHLASWPELCRAAFKNKQAHTPPNFSLPGLSIFGYGGGAVSKHLLFH